MDEETKDIPKKTKGRPPKKSKEELVSNTVNEEIKEVTKKNKGRPSKKSKEELVSNIVNEEIKTAIDLRKTGRVPASIADNKPKLDDSKSSTLTQIDQEQV